MYLTPISEVNWCLGQISIIHMGTMAQLLVGNADDCAWTEEISNAHGGILCPPGFPQEGVDTKQTVRLRHGQKSAEYWRVGLREIRQMNMDTMWRQLVISLHWAEPGSREICSL